MTRVYVYAVLSGPPACEAATGVCAEPLRVVALTGLVALVGDVAEAPAPSAITLRAQDTLLRRLAAGIDAVLPARFGTLVEDDAALAAALDRRRPELTRALGRVAGCAQMTLRVWGEAPAPGLPVLEPGAGGPGTRYLAGRRHVHERARRVPELEPLRSRLGGLVREERAERHDRPPLLATVQHLVERSAGDRYVDTVHAARESLLPWRVSVSGPWLPYAFSEEAA
jgi:hypothetical protein